MYSLFRRKQFRKDLKRILHHPEFDSSILEQILLRLIHEEKLEEKYKHHRLTGEFSDCFECHIQPDILLIYTLDKKEKILYLVRIGRVA